MVIIRGNVIKDDHPEMVKVKELDLPVENNTYLSFCVMGAITGEDPNELQKMAKEQARKNL